MNDQEYDILKDIQEKAEKNDSIDSDNIVKVFTKGKLLIKDPSLERAMERKRNPYQQGPEDNSVYGKLHDQVWSYFVQEKFGKTLEDYLYTRNQPFTEKTTI